MKINSVYFLKSKVKGNHYVLVLDKNKKYIEARKVNVDGSISRATMKLGLKSNLTETNFKVFIQVELPKASRDKLKLNNLLERAEEAKRKYMAVKAKNSLIANQFRKELVRLSLSSFELYNAELGRFYNLRDFGQALRFKKLDTFYSWVLSHFKRQYNKAFFDQIPTCADRTLKQVIDNFRLRLKCYVGFNKEIDKIIMKVVSAYVKEAKRRKLSWV